MQHTTFETFSAVHDQLKARCRCKVSNIVLDSQNLSECLEQKNCFLYTADNALFLLIPYHGAYYDCLYLAQDTKALDEGLAGLLCLYRQPMSIRSSVIGKEALAAPVSDIFQQHDFRLVKKLLRMKTEIIPQTEKAASKVMAAMRAFADEYLDSVSFAEPGDAEEILEILKDNFDLVGDNLPELAAVQKNIEKRQVVVLRQDGKIASLLYFTIKNNIFHGLYDVTRAEYRGGAGLFLANSVFRYEYFKSHGIKFQRFLGWRDAGNKKLMKYANTKSPERPDGVVIYNMLLTSDGERDAGTETRP